MTREVESAGQWIKCGFVWCPSPAVPHNTACWIGDNGGNAPAREDPAGTVDTEHACTHRPVSTAGHMTRK